MWEVCGPGPRCGCLAHVRAAPALPWPGLSWLAPSLPGFSGCPPHTLPCVIRLILHCSKFDYTRWVAGKSD